MRVLSLERYDDVIAALTHRGLAAPGEPVGEGARNARVAIRADARTTFSIAQLDAWRSMLDQSARRLAMALPTDESVDLVKTFAEPWSLALAAQAARMTDLDASRLAPVARIIFLDAAHSMDGETSNNARDAAIELSHDLSRESATAEARTIDVQSFVALSQTLPCFLAAALHALFTHPDQLARLRSGDRGAAPAAVDELLRFAGPSQAVYRNARTDMCIGAVRIAHGDRVAVMLAAANRDPDKFVNPNILDLTRDASGHVALGHGSHACAGTSIVRLAVGVAVHALIDALRGEIRVGDVAWLDGFAIRGPTSLLVSSSSR